MNIHYIGFKIYNSFFYIIYNYLNHYLNHKFVYIWYLIIFMYRHLSLELYHWIGILLSNNINESLNDINSILYQLSPMLICIIKIQ